MLMGLFASHAQYSRKVRDFRMGWGSTLYKSFSKVIQINLYNTPRIEAISLVENHDLLEDRH
jgi:hypothetical protein